MPNKDASVFGVVLLLAILSMLGFVIHVCHTPDSDADNYASLQSCIEDNKQVLVNLKSDSNIPSQERKLRIAYTKKKISACREQLPRYLRYKDVEEPKTIKH